MKKLKLSRNSPVSLLAGLTVGIVSLLGAGSASASLYSSYSITGVTGITGNVQIGGEAQAGANYVNFDSLAGGLTPSEGSPLSLGGGLTMWTAGNAQTESSTVNNASAKPWLSGNNNVFFESPSAITSGGVADPTTYIAAGNVGGGGSLTLSFTSSQNYLGAVWGSVDYGDAQGVLNNLLTFYSGPNGTGSVVATIDGNQIATIDSQLDPTGNGLTGLNGTAYVNLDLAGGFESVVATSGNFTFEMDNLAWGSDPAGVPDGGSTALFVGITLTGLGALRRKLRCRG